MYWTKDWWTGKSLLWGNDSGESMNGTANGETIYGNGGADWINAGGGSDIVYGGVGADTLKGGGGADYLNGGVGADTLIGGTGKDTLTGDYGTDTFVYTTVGDSWANTAGADHITDFQIGDKLDVTDYVEHSRTANGGNVSSMESAQYWANGLASTYGYGSALFTNGKDIYVLMDLNGDKYMETGVVLDNANALGANLNALANHNDFYLFD